MAETRLPVGHVARSGGRVVVVAAGAGVARADAGAAGAGVDIGGDDFRWLRRRCFRLRPSILFDVDFQFDGVGDFLDFVCERQTIPEVILCGV